jgi:hypothetical protein
MLFATLRAHIESCPLSDCSKRIDQVSHDERSLPFTVAMLEAWNGTGKRGLPEQQRIRQQPAVGLSICPYS